jgi:hypothetical protein
MKKSELIPQRGRAATKRTAKTQRAQRKIGKTLGVLCALAVKIFAFLALILLFRY